MLVCRDLEIWYRLLTFVPSRRTLHEGRCGKILSNEDCRFNLQRNETKQARAAKLDNVRYFSRGIAKPCPIGQQENASGVARFPERGRFWKCQLESCHQDKM